MSLAIYLYVLGAMLYWAHPDPRNVRRLTELRDEAVEIASTDAEPEEAITLAAIARHESGFRRHAIGKKGERGPWQVMPPQDPSAAGALRILRRSYELCGNLRYYASGRCDRGGREAAKREATATAYLEGHPYED